MAVSMTKEEAIQAMASGKTVRHEYFSPGESMRLDGDEYLFEDGVRCRTNKRKLEGIIKSKLDWFWFLRSRVRNFKKGSHRKGKTRSNFYYISAYKKIINNPVCYLTGRKIELSNSRSYELDHIIPVCRKGKNSLNNMGLSCREANQAKNDLTVDEFIKLCIEVCEHNGYRVVSK